MNKQKPCKRGNVAERDKWGHCLCRDCKEYNYRRQKETRDPGYLKAWQSKNKERVSGYTKKWNKENADQRKKIVESWRERNPDKVSAMNSKAGKKWAASNKATRMASVRARQAAKIKRTPDWTNKTKMRQFYIEAQRMTEEKRIPHEVDHIYPLQGELVSGLHVQENLRVITRTENRKKGVK